MRVLIFNFEYPPLGGGGGVATKQIAEELAKRHHVIVITTGYKGLPRREECAGVSVVRVPVLGRLSLPTATLLSMLTYVPTALWAGWTLCRREKIDVINAQFVIPSGLPAALLSRWFAIPLVVSFIGGDVYDPTKGVSPHRHFILRWLVRLISNQAVRCTAISRDTKQRAEKLHGVTCPITVTHLGLIPAYVKPTSRDQLGLPGGVPVAVTIGRLIPRKSYEVLLKAWQNVPDAHLVIIGDGPLKAKLERMIQELGLSMRVHMVGFVPEEKKQQLLRTATTYVSAAEHEGFGIVFLEAMEAGLPIVAVNEGGQTDFLSDRVNAMLVPPHDPGALSKAIATLLTDPALTTQMALTNASHVKHFYLERTVLAFEDVLRQAYARK